MHDGPKHDWEKTCVQFLGGAIVGAGVGFYSDGDTPGALVGVISLGLMSASYLDKFWQAIFDWWG